MKSSSGPPCSSVPPQGSEPPKAPPRWNRVLVWCLIVLQITWALAIPVKNVVMIDRPRFRMDSIETNRSLYPSARPSSVLQLTGTQVVLVLDAVLELVLSNTSVREALEAIGTFDLDAIHDLLNPKEFQILAEYYALVFQMSEFPGSTFTPRPYEFNLTKEQALGVWIRPHKNDSSSDWLLRLSCAPQNAALNGMRCFKNATSDAVCIDFPLPHEARRYEPVDLSRLRTNSTGYGNNVGLLYLIEAFQTMMNALLSTRNWHQTITLTHAMLNQIHQSAFLLDFHEGDQLPVIQGDQAQSFGLRLEDLKTQTLESCVVSELVTMLFFTNHYVASKIHQTLMKYQLYDPLVYQLPRNPRMLPVMNQLIDSSHLTISSNVFPAPLSEQGKKLFRTLSMTSIVNSTMHWKIDRSFHGDAVLGSPMRMLEFLSYYPEYYSAYRHQVVNESGRVYDQMTFWTLGGAMSGLNTYKNDWWANTMGVHRLSELSVEDPAHKAWDQYWEVEPQYAAWFQRLEASDNAPFRLLDKHVDIDSHGMAVDDNPATRCHRAFFKTLGKVAVLGMLAHTQLPSYAIFQSQAEGGARPWFFKTMRSTALYGETMTGKRYAFSYSLTTDTRKDDGSAWVMVPFLAAMVENLGKAQTLEYILTSYNTSFTSLVSTEYGLVHFPDMGHCPIGFQRANISKELNRIEQIAERLYPSVALFLADFLDAIPALANQMDQELQLIGLETIRLRPEFFIGSPATPTYAGAIGSPVLWRPSAFQVGMLKFWPAMPPPPKIITAYRQSLRCYQTLELRYLNESVRCWVEPNSVTKSRVEYKSEAFRTVIFANWSIGLILNVIAIGIACNFAYRFVKAYQITKFQCVNVMVALQCHFQGFGVLSSAQILLMAISTIPLMLAYHLPADAVFLPEYEARDLPKFVKDLVISMSASWFHRLGFEYANLFMRLDTVCYWFNAYRLRIVSFLIVFVVRIVTPDQMDNAEYEMWKLIGTCVLAMALGMVCAIAPLRVQRLVHVVTPAQLMEQKHHNLVIASIRKYELPLNQYGLVGYSAQGWSVTGLILEGWKFREHPEKQTVFLIKHRAKIPLRRDRNGQLQCLLKSTSSSSSFHRKRTAIPKS